MANPTIVKLIIFLLLPAVIYSQNSTLENETLINLLSDDISNRAGIYTNLYDVAFVNSSTGFLVSDRGLYYKTIDGGLNWSKHNLPIKIKLNSISINNEIIHIVSDSGYYFRKHLNDSTWNYFKVDESLTVNLTKVEFVNTNHGIISSSSGKYFISSNSGFNWSIHTNITGNYNFQILDSLTIFAAGSDFRISTNKGQNWSNKFIASSEMINSISFVNRNLGFLCGENDRVYKTTNGGDNWLIYTIDNQTTQPKSLIKIKFINEVFGVCLGKGGRIYFTFNSGLTWKRYNNINDEYLVNFAIPDKRRFITIGMNGIIRYSNNIFSSAPIYSISGKVKYSNDSLNVSDGYVIAFHYDYVSKVTTVIDSTGINFDGSYILNNLRIDTCRIVAYPNSKIKNDFIPTYYPSTLFWSVAERIFPEANMTDVNVMVFRDENSVGPSSISGIVYTNLLSNPIENVRIIAKRGNSHLKFSYSGSGGEYSLIDIPAGNYRIYFDKIGFKNDSMTVNLFDNQHLVGINFNMNNVASDVENILIPVEYKLYQNYPNPFNPITNIKFDVYKSSNIVLSIYDISGKIVDKLIEKNLPAGTYNVEWNASGYSSGVYFYKLNIDNFTDVKKMILIK